MTISETFTLGGSYARRARLYPALLASLPAVAVLAYGGELSRVGVVVSALGVLGVFFLVTEIVRGLGRKTERRLVVVWNGLPTTRWVRFSGDGPREMRNRRRSDLEFVTGARLPSQREEKGDPARADRAYRAAVATAISRIRGSETAEGSLLQVENTSYGFRRNLRGLKPYAIGIVAVSAVTNAAIAISMELWLIGIGVFIVQAVALAVWVFVVRDDWVKQQADTYASRFFSAISAMKSLSKR